jgi:hypothetical protein
MKAEKATGAKQDGSLTKVLGFANVFVGEASELPSEAGAAFRPYKHCVKLSSYRLQSLELWSAPTASIDESISLAASAFPNSSRSPLCASKSLFC